jgi:hypothetical protein
LILKCCSWQPLAGSASKGPCRGTASIVTVSAGMGLIWDGPYEDAPAIFIRRALCGDLCRSCGRRRRTVRGGHYAASCRLTEQLSARDRYRAAGGETPGVCCSGLSWVATACRGAVVQFAKSSSCTYLDHLSAMGRQSLLNTSRGDVAQSADWLRNMRNS